MARKVFISYNFNDKQLVHSIKSFFQPYGGTVQGKPVFVTDNVSKDGDKAIDNEIKQGESDGQYFHQPYPQ